MIADIKWGHGGNGHTDPLVPAQTWAYTLARAQTIEHIMEIESIDQNIYLRAETETVKRSYRTINERVQIRLRFYINTINYPN